MSSESLQSIIESFKQEIEEKTRLLEEANSRASDLQKQLDQNVNETSSKEVNFAEVWKENKILRRVIAKETEEVHSVYEKCVAVIQKYQELESQYKEVLSILLNAEPATASQGLLAKLQKENEENKAALESMTNKFTNKKSKYSALKGQFKQVKEELEALKSSNPELNDKAKLLEEISQLKQKLSTKESEVDLLNNQVSDLKVKLETGKYGVNDEAPQAINDFIKSNIEEPDAAELEAKYDAEKEERESKANQPAYAPLKINEIITDATSRERSLLLRIAELESQLNELKEKTGFDIITSSDNQNNDGKPWSFVPRVNVQERSVNYLGVSVKEEEDEIDPQDLPNVEVSAINSPKPEDRHNLASNSDEENLNDENIDLDSEYEALLNSGNVANKELITKLMAEVRKLRKELHKDKKERKELIERLERSGSILGSAPQSPKGQVQVDDSENYNSNEIETETDNNDEKVTDKSEVVTRAVAIIEEEEEQPDEQSNPINAEYTNEEEEHQFAKEYEAQQATEEAEAARAVKEAEELAALLDKPPAEDLDEANSRIKLLEEQIKKLCEQINNLQFAESSLNASSINGNDSHLSHDFQNAIKRIAKLQKKLEDRSKPPENMQQFEDEIARLKKELQESSDRARDLQSHLDSFSNATNNGVVEVVKENQNMKKTIEKKDKEIEDATKKGAEILAKYNEQQDTIKTLINELKAAKARNNESQKAISELNASVEQLQQDLDQADAEAESYKDDLSKFDELSAKLILAQTELDTTKIKLDKTTALLKTKGGPRAIYALEEYDNIVGYKAEIAAQQELLKEIEEALGLPQDSLLNLVDKEGQPRPDIENENNENQQEEEQQNEIDNEERIQRNKEALRKLLHGIKQSGGDSQVLLSNHLLFESGNDFFNECDKRNEEYDKLAKETNRMRTILAHVEEELHLEPGHLTDRQIENELIAGEGQENGEEGNRLPSGWLNKLVAENNGGNGLLVKTRDLKLDEEEEEEDSEKAKEIERLNAENTNHQSKIFELEGDREQLRRQIIKLNNQIALLNTDRLAAIQTNTILTDKCVDLQKKLTKLNNETKSSNASLSFSEFENDYILAKQKAEESQEKIQKLKVALGTAKSESQRAAGLEDQVHELSTTIKQMKKEKIELQKRIAELEIMNA